MLHERFSNGTKGQHEMESETELQLFLYAYTSLMVFLTMVMGNFFRWFEPQIYGGLEVIADWLGRGNPPVTLTS